MFLIAMPMPPKFYESLRSWPKIVIKIIGWYSSVFANEKAAPSDPILGLKWHQDHSAPTMQQIKVIVTP